MLKVFINDLTYMTLNPTQEQYVNNYIGTGKVFENQQWTSDIESYSQVDTFQVVGRVEDRIHPYHGEGVLGKMYLRADSFE